MKKFKKFNQFVSETFTLTSDKIPEIGDVVDKIEYNDGDKIAFIDFGGVKNIPVQIVNPETEITTENRNNKPAVDFDNKVKTIMTRTKFRDRISEIINAETPELQTKYINKLYADVKITK